MHYQALPKRLGNQKRDRDHAENHLRNFSDKELQAHTGIYINAPFFNKFNLNKSQVSPETASITYCT
jgi:hypothetical protein